MTFAAPIRRVDTAKGHHYKDANGARVPGVTTILGGGLPKSALVDWAANATAQGAVDGWDDFTAMPPAKRYAALQKVRYAEKDAAAKRGTEIHGYGEILVKGEAAENVPPELLPYVESYARFLDDFKVEPVQIEFSIASYKYGYAGTADLIAELDVPKLGRKRLLIDLKSNRSGIFGETALQLAAYRYADVICGTADTDEIPMPEVEGCAAVHITPNGAHLVPVTADDTELLTFRYVKKIWEWDKVSRDLVGEAVRPETPSVYRLVRENS